MMNMLLMLDEVSFCAEGGVNVLVSIIGAVIYVIKIAVPFILIIVGMIELAKASTSKDEDTIKKAQKLLVKKLIIGFAVFLVPTIVTLLMSVIGSTDWQDCVGECLNSPFNDNCIKAISNNPFGQ